MVNLCLPFADPAEPDPGRRAGGSAPAAGGALPPAAGSAGRPWMFGPGFEAGPLQALGGLDAGFPPGLAGGRVDGVAQQGAAEPAQGGLAQGWAEGWAEGSAEGWAEGSAEGSTEGLADGPGAWLCQGRVASPHPGPTSGRVSGRVSGPVSGPVPGIPGAGPFVDPLALHPALWRASQVGGGAGRGTPSGFAALDAELPGGGWPHGVLTELLLPRPGIGELRLLAPALAALAGGHHVPTGGVAGLAAAGHRALTGGAANPAAGQPAPTGGRAPPAGRRGSGRAARTAAGAVADPAGAVGAGSGGAALAGGGVMLFDPPARLSAWALAQQGLDSRHWVVVQPRSVQRHPRNRSGLAPVLPQADLLWALEQALRSGQVAVVLAWLPLALRADALRRLQLAAQAHEGPVFLFREAAAASRPSPAPLRLSLQPLGVDGLSLRIIKRRGPPLAQPLRLVLPPVLTPRQQARAETRDALDRVLDRTLERAAAGTGTPQRAAADTGAPRRAASGIGALRRPVSSGPAGPSGPPDSSGPSWPGGPVDPTPDDRPPGPPVVPRLPVR